MHKYNYWLGAATGDQTERCWTGKEDSTALRSTRDRDGVETLGGHGTGEASVSTLMTDPLLALRS